MNLRSNRTQSDKEKQQIDQEVLNDANSQQYAIFKQINDNSKQKQVQIDSSILPSLATIKKNQKITGKDLKQYNIKESEFEEVLDGLTDLLCEFNKNSKIQTKKKKKIIESNELELKKKIKQKNQNDQQEFSNQINQNQNQQYNTKFQQKQVDPILQKKFQSNQNVEEQRRFLNINGNQQQQNQNQTQLEMILSLAQLKPQNLFYLQNAQLLEQLQKAALIPYFLNQRNQEQQLQSQSVNANFNSSFNSQNSYYHQQEQQQKNQFSIQPKHNNFNQSLQCQYFGKKFFTRATIHIATAYLIWIQQKKSQGIQQLNNDEMDPTYAARKLREKGNQKSGNFGNKEINSSKTEPKNQILSQQLNTQKEQISEKKNSIEEENHEQEQKNDAQNQENSQQIIGNNEKQVNDN